MIKDYLKHKDIGKIATIANVSRAYVNQVLNSIEDLADAKALGKQSETKRRILDAANEVIQQHMIETEQSLVKQKTIHAKRMMRLRKCAKSLAK